MSKEQIRFAQSPKKGTVSAREYFKAGFSTFWFMNFLVDTVLLSDYGTTILKKALDGQEWKYLSTPLEAAKKEPGPGIIFLRKNRQTMLEVFLGRFVDNFQSYIVDLLRQVLAEDPRILITSQTTLSLEYVLKFQTMDELTAEVVEAKVNDLSYQGFAKLRDWCMERVIPIVVAPGHEAAIVELIATRNVITHNRGLIDKKYLRAVPESRFKLGSKRSLDVDYLVIAFNILNRVVTDTDASARGKFSLPEVDFGGGEIEKPKLGGSA